MTRIILSVMLAASTTGASLARGELSELPLLTQAPPITAPAAPGPDLVGLDSMKNLLQWLRKLPAAFDSFVSSEKREQLARRMRTLSDAFAKVNERCVNLARLVVESDTREDDLHKPFRTLVDTIVELRGEVLKLAADLDVEAGRTGRDVAFELASMTGHRADMTAEARRQVFGGERTAAAKKLRQAGELAEQAQKLVLDFIPALKMNR